MSIDKISSVPCDTCGVGYYLPSGVCDHCDTAKPGSELAALREDRDRIEWLYYNPSAWRRYADEYDACPIDRLPPSPRKWIDEQRSAPKP